MIDKNVCHNEGWLLFRHELAQEKIRLAQGLDPDEHPLYKGKRVSFACGR